jgi:Fe-S-cluster containining protein
VNIVCLPFHAGFRCRHSGACCTSGWPIHVETDRLATLRHAIDAGRLAIPLDCAREGSPFLEPGGLPSDAGAVLRTTVSGACVFYERSGGLCAIQRTLGHDHIPSACQHFPRRCLIEPDRIAVSLSHYCPTVARLAFRTDVRPEVVPAPAPLVGYVALEGLDAREALPPLLRPGLLTDLAGYRAWERVVIEVLASPRTPEDALAAISAFTERVRAWTPRAGELLEAVEHAAPRGDRSPAAIGRGHHDGPRASWSADDYEAVRGAVPAGIETAPASDRIAAIDARWVADAWPRFSQPLRHFLAAHAFGNWCAYHGMGLRTVVRSLAVALAVVRVEAARLCATAERLLDEPLLIEALRAADLLLVHLADPKALAARLSAVEPQR